MKSIYTLAAMTVLAAGSAYAQPAPRDLCAANQAANAAVIARAQAAETPAARQAILKQAIDANPANAVCIADLALQLGLAANVDPAAGPEEFGGAAEIAGTTDGVAAPAENPNQLNQGATPGSASEAVPAL
jgi:hypothetical protein